MNFTRITDEQLTQALISKRFVPPIPPHLEEKIWSMFLIVNIF